MRPQSQGMCSNQSHGQRCLGKAPTTLSWKASAQGDGSYPKPLCDLPCGLQHRPLQMSYLADLGSSWGIAVSTRNCCGDQEPWLLVLLNILALLQECRRKPLYRERSLSPPLSTPDLPSTVPAPVHHTSRAIRDAMSAGLTDPPLLGS